MVSCVDALPFVTDYPLHAAQLCQVIVCLVTLVLIIVVFVRKEYRNVPVHPNLRVTCLDIYVMWHGLSGYICQPACDLCPRGHRNRRRPLAPSGKRSRDAAMEGNLVFQFMAEFSLKTSNGYPTLTCFDGPNRLFQITYYTHSDGADPCRLMLRSWMSATIRGVCYVYLLGYSLGHVTVTVERTWATLKPSNYENVRPLYGRIAAAMVVIFAFYSLDTQPHLSGCWPSRIPPLSLGSPGRMMSTVTQPSSSISQQRQIPSLYLSRTLDCSFSTRVRQ